MTLVYRFRSIVLTLLCLPVGFLVVRGAFWLIRTIPYGNTRLMEAEGDLLVVILMEIFFLLSLVSMLTYRKYVAIDAAKKMRTWHSISGLTFSKKEGGLTGIAKITLTSRIVEVWYARRHTIRMTYLFLEFAGKGKKRIEIHKFLRWGRGQARRMGWEIANLLQIPFSDFTGLQKGAVFGDPTVITRDQVRKLLLQWERKEVTADEVVQWSEDHHPDQGFRYGDVNHDEWERGEVESVINEVLLKIEYTESLTAEQIPIFLRFLDSDPTDFKNAFKEFKNSTECSLKKLVSGQLSSSQGQGGGSCPSFLTSNDFTTPKHL